MPIYTQTQLLSDVNARIKGKIGILVDFQSTLNQGVRQSFSEIDFLTSRRRTPLTPNLFSGVFEYAAPTDLKGYGIITVQNQKWTKTPFWSLVPYEQFMRRQDTNTIAISDYDFIRKVYINSQISDTKTTLAGMDSLSSGGGTWKSFGDGTNISVGTDNYVEGSASIKFDISAAGGTTCGLVNSTLNPTDLSAYLNGDGNCIVWAYITSTTNLTNYILRIGSSASNYYTKTVTTQSDGTAFVNGWNLLNFNLATFTTIGTPVATALNYCATYFTKTAGKVSETGYRFDYILFRRGEINNIYYYSGYGWQSSTGIYKVNSTTDSDVLNAGEQEYEIILARCTELASFEVDEDKVTRYSPGVTASLYKELKKIYQMSNPSESLIMISTTTNFIKV